jgi:hypothetical protein
MAKDSVFERAMVHIEWPCGAPPPVLRCPMTGQVVLQGYDPVTGEDTGFDEPDWSAVPTVTFCYLPEVGEFQYITPALESTIAASREALLERATADEKDAIELLSDFEILESYVDEIGEVPLVVCLTTSGMACGPVSSSVYVGLDLAAALPHAKEEAA